MTAKPLILGRIAEEIHHFLHFLLRLIAACDIREADRIAHTVQHTGLALPKREGTALAAALHLAHEENPHTNQEKHREPGDKDGRPDRRLFLSLAVHGNAILPQVIHHPEVARRRDLVLGAGIRLHENLPALNIDTLDLPSLGVIHKLCVAGGINGNIGAVVELLKDRKEDDSHQYPYGHASKHLIVQC